MTIHCTEIATPVGGLLVSADESGLRTIHFQAGRSGPRQPEPHWVEGEAPFDSLRRQLEEYFAGQRREFDLQLAPQGTQFQRAVWSQLQRIVYGETISYLELARRVGNERASRAVGLANGANPLPIVIPCHRVIGSNGALTGFGGGLETKRQLLQLEGAECLRRP